MNVYEKMPQYIAAEFLSMLKGRETGSYNLVGFRARRIILSEMLNELGQNKETARVAGDVEHERQLQISWNEMALTLTAANQCILALGSQLERRSRCRVLRA